jgi:hypothetical protein
MAKVGYVNAGLIRRDLRTVKQRFAVLQQTSVEQMMNILSKAADLFLHSELPVSSEQNQSKEEYVKILSATCGFPYALIRSNMLKIVEVMQNMPAILKGLTRDLDLSAIDTGLSKQNNTAQQFSRCKFTLAACGGTADTGSSETGPGRSMDSFADHQCIADCRLSV